MKGEIFNQFFQKIKIVINKKIYISNNNFSELKKQKLNNKINIE